MEPGAGWQQLAAQGPIFAGGGLCLALAGLHLPPAACRLPSDGAQTGCQPPCNNHGLPSSTVSTHLIWVVRLSLQGGAGPRVGVVGPDACGLAAGSTMHLALTVCTLPCSNEGLQGAPAWSSEHGGLVSHLW